MSTKNPSAAPTAVRVFGALALIIAALSLCAASYRMIEPEVGLPTGAADKLMADGLVAAVVMICLGLLVAASALLAAAAIGMLLGKRWGRRLGLIWAWSELGVQAVALIASALAVGARAGAAEITRADAVAAAFSVPGTGGCASFFALILLLGLLHSAVREWARG